MRKIISGLLRFPILMLYVVGYSLESIIYSFSYLDKLNIQKKRAFLVSRYCKKTLKLLKIDVAVSDYINNADKGQFQCANHVSYIDIFIIASLNPTLFISSYEMKTRSILGTIARLGGSIFVERRNRYKIKDDIENIRKWIRLGFTVTLFPESTTYNGDTVHPFKSSLFATIEKSSQALAPICINYKTIGGVKISRQNRDKLFYYGNISFIPHFIGLLFRDGVTASVSLLPLQQCEKKGRKELAQIAHQQILSHFKEIKDDSYCHNF